MNKSHDVSLEIEEIDSTQFRINCLSNGKRLSGGRFKKVKLHLNGAVVNGLAAVGIGTDPENRRLGLVRRMFEVSSVIAKEQNFPVSILHPFSFAYYRKFGFERVSDTRILEFPISALNFVDRCSDFVRCADESFIPLLDEVYNLFAAKRNLAFPRNGNMNYGISDEKKKVYISFDENGKPDAYLTLNVENYFYVNKMVSVNLNVYEYAFTSPAALDKIFGFMRMFEGELETVKIHECGLAPEVERRLRHYHHTKITVIPDIMARINDVEAVLNLVEYPVGKGEFTVKVYEPEGSPYLKEKTTGIWNVKYEDKKALVTKLDNTCSYDLCADVPAFTQLIFGYECSGIETARYIPNTEFKNECEDFFRAFPNRPAGVFEHF